MAASEPLTIIKDAAEELGVGERTVRDLLRTNAIPTSRVPHSPTARGIKPSGMKRLRTLLNIPEPEEATA